MNPIVKAWAPLLLILALVGAFFWTAHQNYADGYSEGFQKAQAQGDTALSKLKADHAQELAQQALAAKRAAEVATEWLLSEIDRGNGLAAELAAKKAELRRTTENLTKEIANVTTSYRRALDAQLEPLPPSVFTNGFVRLWNSALGSAGATAVQASAATSGTDAAAGGTGAADSLDSGISQARLLGNHIRNSESAASCRAQLNSLIEWNTNGRN